MIKPNTAYLCKTEEIAKKVIALMIEQFDIPKTSGSITPNCHNWIQYKEKTCFIYEGVIRYGELCYLQEDNYEIIDAETLFTPTETPTEPQKDTATIEQPSGEETGVVGHNAEPIMQFTSQQQLDESLKEWQARLGLSDWIIKSKLCKVLDSIFANGNCFSNYIAKTAEISILKEPNENSGTNYMKFCAEETLVHELLHCVIYGSTIINENKCSISEQYMDTRIHAELESLAMAFIMAKYNLTLDWFKV